MKRSRQQIRQTTATRDSQRSELKHTLVYTYGGGRFGNQLLNYINLLSFQFEYPDFDVYDAAFLPYSDLYDAEDMSLLSLDDPSGPIERAVGTFWGDGIGGRIGTCTPDRVRLRALHWAAHGVPFAQSIIGGELCLGFDLPGQQYDVFTLSESSNLTTLRSRQTSIAAGWRVRCWPLVGNYRTEIQEHLQPEQRFMTPARRHVSGLVDQFDVVVGVLIRQDDYREWRDGRYFFTSKRYRTWLEQYSDHHPDERVGFLIASDEDQSRQLFEPDEYTFATGEAVGKNHFMESFAELSLCDIILTPPSTFSTAAAFLGDVPIVPLYDGVSDDGWERLDEPLLGSLDHHTMNDSIK
jgi:hypothetical protein